MDTYELREAQVGPVGGGVSAPDSQTAKRCEWYFDESDGCALMRGQARLSHTAASEGPHYDMAPLMRFYNVSSIPDLIDAQAKHIERLQAKLPPTRDAFPRTPREG